MRRFFITNFPIGLLAVAMIGCNHQTVVGKWKVDPALANDQSIQPAGFMTGFSATFWYDLKKDGTFDGSMTSGTYKIDGNNVTLTTTKMGQTVLPQPQPMTGELSEGGTKLTLHLPESSVKVLGKMLPDKLKAGIPMVKEKAD